MLRINYTGDLKRGHAAVILCAILGAYGASAIPELSDPGDFPDYDFMITAVAKWTPSDIAEGYGHHVKFALAKVSAEVFHNHHAVPLALSLGLVGATYLLGAQLSGKRIWGLAAASVLALSNIFRQFDTSAVYPNDWVLFFVLSLYFVQKKWQLSPAFFIMSILAKPLAILFLPAMVWMVVRSAIGRRQKVLLVSLYAGLVAFALVAANGYESYSRVPFNGWAFMFGAMEWVYFFMVPDFWLAALIPLSMLMLLMLASKGAPAAGTMLVLMVNVAVFGGVLEGMTSNLWNEPYRYIPLIALFACSIGIVYEGARDRIRHKKSLLPLGSNYT